MFNLIREFMHDAVSKEKHEEAQLRSALRITWASATVVLIILALITIFVLEIASYGS